MCYGDLFFINCFHKKNWYTTNPTLISTFQKHLFDFSFVTIVKRKFSFFLHSSKKIYTTYTINLISLIHSNFRKNIVKSSIWLKEYKLLIENHAFGIPVKKSVNNLHKKYVREFSFFFNLDQSGSSAKSIENVNRENLVNWIRFSKNVLCIKSKRDTGDNFGYKKFQSHSSFEIRSK